jgi:hypothetical protein
LPYGQYSGKNDCGIHEKVRVATPSMGAAMSTHPVHLERRAAQRFALHLPVFLRLPRSAREASAFTQDLSARGALLYTDLPLSVGEAIELTLVMPSQITLGEDMRVRCSGTVKRVIQPVAGNTFGVAVYLEAYDYLPATETTVEASASFARISALHQQNREEKPAEELNPRIAALR